MVAAVEVEIDSPHNENLHFRPLQRAVRGRFDWMRIGEPMSKVKAAEWPVPIPSQRLGVDPDGNGYLLEPLHDDEYSPIREKIEGKLGMKLEPAVQTFESVHLPSWYFWLAKAVECGLATVVSGKLPRDIGGEPRRNFYWSEPAPSATDKLTAAIERQSQLFEKLLAKLGEGK